jgi:hypothetical protein
MPGAMAVACVIMTHMIMIVVVIMIVVMAATTGGSCHGRPLW